MSKFVLEWSKKSNGFHIQPIETTLAKNQQFFLENKSHDYLVLMVGSHEACCSMADSWRSKTLDRIVHKTFAEAI